MQLGEGTMRGTRYHGRNERHRAGEWVKTVLGAVFGLVIGYCLLRFGFGVRIFESRATPPPTAIQPAAQASTEKAPEVQVAEASGEPRIAPVPDPPEKVPANLETVKSVAVESSPTTQEADESTKSSPHEDTIEPEIETPIAADPFATPETPVESGAPSAEVKQAIPSPEQQTPIAEQVKEIFKDEYAAAITPDLQAALASRLGTEASTIQDDPIAKFVTFRQAYVLALSAGDHVLAEAIALDFDAAFDLDFSKIMAHLLTSVTHTAKSTDARRDIATKCLNLVPTLLKVQRLDEALLLVTAGKELASRVGDANLQRQATSMMEETQRVQRVQGEVQAARDRLREVPDDAAASLALGRYMCADEQNWQQGLPLLAKGSDATLAAAADLDLAGAASSSEQLAIADAWYTACTSGDGYAGLMARAQFWYQNAATGLGGLERVKVNKRLQELADSATRISQQHEAVRVIAPLNAAVAKAIQAAWARYLEVPIIQRNSIGMTLALIPPGEFLMGSPPSETGRGDIELLHYAKIAKPYYIGTSEITQKQYETIMGVNPSGFSRHGRCAARVEGLDTEGFPVEMVTPQSAIEFCNKLCKRRVEKDHGRSYRLPTEEEWEYACRAGSQSAFHFGDEHGQLNSYAWYGDNSGDTPLNATDEFGKLKFDDYWKKLYSNGGRPHAVATKASNAWGLFDVHGNVWEFCEVAYVSVDPSVPDVHPVGRSDNQEYLGRGGSWFFPSTLCRSAFRRPQKPEDAHEDCGFRVVCTIGDR